MQVNPQQSSRSHLKLTESDPNSIQKNALNSSKSKMQYSIPKSKRWSEVKTSTSSKFYELPTLKSSRSTSLGYGNKIDISKRNVITPSPSNYMVLGEFEQLSPKKNGISMGLGRDNVKNVSTFNEKPFKIPGPSDYEVKNVEHKAPFYSMKSRNPDLSEKWVRSVPGPGTYSTIELVRNNNKIQLSNIQSTPSAVFPKKKRTSDYEDRLKVARVPGPGQYSTLECDEKSAKFAVHGGRRFGKSQRKGIVDKSITPGPGAYGSFSEFIY